MATAWVNFPPSPHQGRTTIAGGHSQREMALSVCWGVGVQVEELQAHRGLSSQQEEHLPRLLSPRRDLHLTDGETEAQRDTVSAQGHTAWGQSEPHGGFPGAGWATSEVPPHRRVPGSCPGLEDMVSWGGCRSSWIRAQGHEQGRRGQQVPSLPPSATRHRGLPGGGGGGGGESPWAAEWAPCSWPHLPLGHPGTFPGRLLS